VFRKVARKRGEFLYFVGGVVRDYILLLKGKLRAKPKGLKDVDIVLEGDTESYVKEVLNGLEGRVVFKSQFLTYKLELRNGLVVDLITARRETYEGIAALPKVEPSNFVDDILRRDFRINTLLLGLTPPYEEVIVDLLGGVEDIDSEVVEPLHENSFVDDPTRIFRGVRYKVRLGFRFGKDFDRALLKAKQLQSLKKLSPARVFNELKLFVLKEPEQNLAELFRHLEELGVLSAFGLRLCRDFEERLNFLKKVKKELDEKKFVEVVLLVISEEFKEDALLSLGISPRTLKDVTKALAQVEILKRVKDRCERCLIMERQKDWATCVVGARLKELREDVLFYFNEYKKVKPPLSGRELKALGITSGKEVGKALRLLKCAALRGEIKDREDAVKFLKAKGFSS